MIDVNSVMNLIFQKKLQRLIIVFILMLSVSIILGKKIKKDDQPERENLFLKRRKVNNKEKIRAAPVGQKGDKGSEKKF